MAHELPAALLHFVHGLGMDFADLRIQRDGRFDAGGVEHVGDAPQPDAHPVFPPGVVDNVGHMVRGIGRNAGADGRVVVPDLDIRDEPDGKRFVARPFERLSLEDERIVVALRPADRLRRGLRLRRQRPQA